MATSLEAAPLVERFTSDEDRTNAMQLTLANGRGHQTDTLGVVVVVAAKELFANADSKDQDFAQSSAHTPFRQRGYARPVEK